MKEKLSNLLWICVAIIFIGLIVAFPVYLFTSSNDDKGSGNAGASYSDYDYGYDEGYSDGYDDGLYEGLDSGYEQGFSERSVDAEEESIESFNCGYDEGIGEFEQFLESKRIFIDRKELNEWLEANSNYYTE